MNRGCEQCGHNPQQVSARHRTPAAYCEDCGEWVCIDCLRDDAVEFGLLQPWEADALHGEGDAMAFMYRCEASEQTMCPRCFEYVDEDESAEQEDPVENESNC